MSIVLHIKYRSSDIMDVIPVAPQHVFAEIWLPAIKALDLKWLPLFDAGYPFLKIDEDTILDIINEFKELREYFAHSENDTLSHIIIRFDKIISALEQALEKLEAIEYIRV